MKLKYLLMTLAVLACFTASAADDEIAYTNCGDRLTSENVVIQRDQPGYTEIPLMLTRQTSPDFTNIQFDLVFPEGIRPYYDEADGVYGYEGDDMYTRRKFYVDFSHNMNHTEFYPVYTLFGLNIGKNKITANPANVYVVYVKADADMAPGDYVLKAKKLKYTCYDNNSYATADLQEVCTITVEAPLATAVKDVSAANGVAGVKYINLAGVVSSEPFNGVNIKVETLTDGSTRTTKFVK